MRVVVGGVLAPGIVAKDIVMALIRKIGASGATGYAVEFSGPVISVLNVEGRMTICNMIVEGGARGVVIAPDDGELGHQPGSGRADRRRSARPDCRAGPEPPPGHGAGPGLYGLEPGMLSGIPIDRAFIGSCTNARIEDLRAAAAVVRGRHVEGP